MNAFMEELLWLAENWFFILVLKMGIATLFAFAVGGVCVPGAWLEEREKEQGEVNREVNGKK